MPACQTWMLVCDGCGADWFPTAPAPKSLSASRGLAAAKGWTWTFHEPEHGRLGWYTYRCPWCNKDGRR